jgi:hypothetical protein
MACAPVDSLFGFSDTYRAAQHHALAHPLITCNLFFLIWQAMLTSAINGEKQVETVGSI